MRSTVAGLFYTVMLACGAMMTFWYFAALIDWLGVVFGVLVGVFVIPGAVVFPLVYWLVEGFLPMPYLLTWVAGMGCLIGASLCSRNR